MKYWRKLIATFSVVSAVTLSGGIFFLNQAHAATGQLYISPSSTSVKNGGNVTVSVRVNPGTPVDTVTATVTYNASQLKYVSLNYAGSPFSTQIPATISSGSITVDSGDLSGKVSSDSLVASITFTALSGSGSDTLGLSGNAAAAGTYTNHSTAGSTIGFTSSTCPSGETGTPPNCKTVSTGGGNSGGSGGGSSGSGGGSGSSSGGSHHSSSGGGSGSKGGGSISSPKGTPVTITRTDIEFTKAVINVTSANPTKVYIRFGLDGQLTTNTPITGFADSHTITINSSLLEPGETYSYIVVSVNQAGVTDQTGVHTFSTAGFKVEIGVFDKHHNPLRHVQVTLHSTAYNATTDNNGVATFSNVAPGTHTLTYTSGGKNYTQTIEVANVLKTVGGVQTAPLQNFSVVYDVVQPASIWGAPWFIVTLIVLIALLVVVLVRNRLQLTLSKPAPTLDNIVVGGNSQPEPIKSEEVQDKAQVEVAAKLQNVPFPEKPAPGNTISPQSQDESNRTEAGK